MWCMHVPLSEVSIRYVSNKNNKMYTIHKHYIDGIRPKGPYLPCLRMADLALLAGYPRYIHNFMGDIFFFIALLEPFSIHCWDSYLSSFTVYDLAQSQTEHRLWCSNLAVRFRDIREWGYITGYPNNVRMTSYYCHRHHSHMHPLILRGQFHGFWWPGETKYQQACKQGWSIYCSLFHASALKTILFVKSAKYSHWYSPGILSEILMPLYPLFNM